MQALDALVDRLGIASELLTFLWQNRLWWLIPLVAILLFFGIIIVFGSSSGIGPFIYGMF